MDVRGNFRFRLTRFRLAILPIAAIVAMAAALALSAAPAAAARHARRAAAKETSAVPLDQIHVLGDRPAPFGLNAKAAMMIDARSGATLYAFNEHEKIQPASLAKLMTFYLVLKALHQGRITPDTMVTVSEKAWRLSMNSTVSRMFLQVGQRVVGQRPVVRPDGVLGQRRRGRAGRVPGRLERRVRRADESTGQGARPRPRRTSPIPTDCRCPRCTPPLSTW